jgi:hypothetical protein
MGIFYKISAVTQLQLHIYYIQIYFEVTLEGVIKIIQQ